MATLYYQLFVNTQIYTDFVCLCSFVSPLQKPKDLNTHAIEISTCIRTSLDSLAITEAL